MAFKSKRNLILILYVSGGVLDPVGVGDPDGGGALAAAAAPGPPGLVQPAGAHSHPAGGAFFFLLFVFLFIIIIFFLYINMLPIAGAGPVSDASVLRSQIVQGNGGLGCSKIKNYLS